MRRYPYFCADSLGAFITNGRETSAMGKNVGSTMRSDPVALYAEDPGSETCGEEKNQFIRKTLMDWVVECSALGFLLPGVTFAGYLLGYVLDKAWGTHWIYIPGLILGMIAGFVLLIREVRRDTQDDGA